MADQGQLADLSDVVDQDDLDDMVPGALEAGQVDGTQYAVPMSINVKSIVFYPKQAARRPGYRGPRRPCDDLVHADRHRSRRRHHAVVLRHRVRGGDRLAGHRLGREPDA